MRKSLLALPLLTLALSGCQSSSEGAMIAAAPAQEAITPSISNCQPFSQPTVVRYQSRLDRRTLHSVHLLNGNSGTAQLAGCPNGLPLASIVSLSYQIAGG